MEKKNGMETALKRQPFYVLWEFRYYGWGDFGNC